jgi:hypothetical protein
MLTRFEKFVALPSSLPPGNLTVLRPALALLFLPTSMLSCGLTNEVIFIDLH